MQDFKKLKVWQKTLGLIKTAYQVTANFPPEEKYALTSQTRRAIVSISNNIAEGCGRFTKNDFLHFLQMALGSTNEVENCLIICRELEFLSVESFNDLNDRNIEIRKMLIALIEKIRGEK